MNALVSEVLWNTELNKNILLDSYVSYDIVCLIMKMNELKVQVYVWSTQSSSGRIFVFRCKRHSIFFE